MSDANWTPPDYHWFIIREIEVPADSWREAWADRIDAMAGLYPPASGGGIDRTPSPWWPRR